MPTTPPITSLDRLSTCSICLHKSSLDEALAVIKEAGFNKVDLLGRMPHFSIEPEELRVEEIEAAFARHGLKAANLGTYFGQSLSPDSTQQEIDAEIERMARGIDIAKRLGSRSIRVQPGRDRAHATAHALTPFFRQVAKMAAEHNIYVGIETHGGITSDPPAMAEFCSKVGHGNFGVIYDPCNLAAVGVDYVEAYRSLKECTVHVHLKDGHLQDGAWRRVMFGDGTIDMAWILTQLEADGYAGDFALEYEVAEIEPPATGLIKWLQRYEELLERIA